MKYIYYLQDDLSNKIFWIGRTSQPKKRLLCHKSKFHNKNISLVIIEECNTKNANAREFYYIQKYYLDGHPLLNKHMYGKTAEMMKLKRK